MNTRPNSEAGKNYGSEQVDSLIREFFQTDCASEIIHSLNTLTEVYLFSENLAVTPEMRVHIANQLRVVTFISRLGKSV